jgi:glycosyl transferase family 25
MDENCFTSFTSLGSLETITNAFYINLEHRLDRRVHIENELSRIGIKAERFNAIKMENGAIGCSMSHLKILQNAFKNKMSHVLIVEDDIVFLDIETFRNNFNAFLQTRGTNWDVILLAGNNMPPYTRIDETSIQVTRCQTTTGYLVNGHYIQKLMENVKMGLHNLLKYPKHHALYAIDKFWQDLQKVDRWFLITPLTVIQKEDYSDIEKKMINYNKPMLDLDKADLLKKIRNYNLNNLNNRLFK